MLKFIKRFGLFIFWLFLVSCAIQGAGPVGGDKDVIPPKPLNMVPANKTTQFKSQKLILDFDEYIDLNNPAKEIYITPTPEGNPFYSVKGKSLEISLKEISLLPNTTYTINFGKAIKDYHEGNIQDSLKYVFSTGDYLDSFKLIGRTKSLLSDKLPENSIAVLYKPGNDSAIFKKKPLYYTKVTNEGNFEFENLPTNTFRLYVIGDKNGNLMLDAGEYAGFLENDIKIPAMDTLKEVINLVPTQPLNLIITTAKVYPNYASLQFNQVPDSVKVRIKDSLITTYALNADSILLWAKGNDFSNGISVWVKAGSEIEDTLIMPNQKSFKVAVTTLTALNDITAFNTYNTPLVIESRQPIAKMDTSKYKFVLGEKPLKFQSVRILNKERTKVGFYFPFLKDSLYHVSIYPHAFTFLNNTTNDSFATGVILPDSRSYAILEVNVILPKNGSNYIFQLIKEGGDVFYDKSLSNSEKIKITYVPAGKYKLRLIEDSNHNGRFDAGNVLKRIMPEKVYDYKKILDLKQNWEMLDLSFDISK